MLESKSPGPEIDTFLFDIGNVLVTFDFSKVITFLAEKSNSDASTIKNTVEQLIVPLETGTIDSSTFFRELTEKISYAGNAQALHNAYVDIFVANTPMHRLVDSISTTYRLVLFSNTSDLHKDWLFAQYPVFSKFHDGVFSYISGSMKPDDGMYLDAIHNFGIDPARTIYLDDAPANVAAGLRHGFNAIPYLPNHHKEVLAQITELGAEVGCSQ